MANEFIVQDVLVVVDETGDSVITVRSIATNESIVNFGDEVSDIAGQIIYDHTTDTFNFGFGGVAELSLTSGTATFAGDLVVDGTTTTVNSANLNITDNVILLNKDETGPGVTLGVAGIEIERGPTTDNAGWYFNESENWWGPTGPEGSLLPDVGVTQTIGNIAVIDSTDATEEVLTINGAAIKISVVANDGARPATPVDGMFLYNTFENAFQGRENGAWVEFSTGVPGVGFLSSAGGSLTGDLTMTSAARIFIEEGTAADPGLAFDADQDTGIFRDGDDRLGFSAGGFSQLVISTTAIDGEGNTLTDIADPSSDLHVGDRGYNDARYVELAGDTMTGDLNIAADILPDSTANLRDIGSVTKVFQTVYATTFEGTATMALYADVAERYAADMDLEPGDVVIVGGEAEITKSFNAYDKRVAGVISTQPGMMLNSEAGPDKTHPYLAISGRVPCKVIGRIKKGDLLVTSVVSGRAKAATIDSFKKIGSVFAKALEDHNTYAEGIIEVMITHS